MASTMIGNRYIIVKAIGSGGMADVFLAIDSILKREVAVKVLKGELASDPVNLERFQKEAMAISNTSHPNIVEIFDVGVDNDKNYIVMEYVHGKTLKQLIRQRGYLPIEETVNIMKQLVSAVGHAHKVGIIHRDIKSQNVLIKDDGTVKLSDFGIAYTGDATLTKTDTIMGSVHYLAPELASGEMCTVQSDIYSLGIVFYEMLTGKVPFTGEKAVDVALQHMHNDVPSVRQFNPQIPQAVENIVTKSTARNRQYRYGNASEMYNDIVTCLDLSRSNEAKFDIKKLEDEEKTNVRQVKVSKKEKHFITPTAILMIVLAAILTVFCIFAIKTLTQGGSDTKKIKIPMVTGYALDEAKSVIIAEGLKIESITYQSSDSVDAGLVISISPSGGSEVAEGSTVSLIVSEGKNFTLGNYVGKDRYEVCALLEHAGFTVNITEVKTNEYPFDSVIYQNVSAGKVYKPNDVKIINLSVAVYPSDYIPDVLGKDIEEAKKQLEALGFKVELVQGNVEDNIDVETGEYINDLNTVVKCSPDINEFYTQDETSVITLTYY